MYQPASKRHSEGVLRPSLWRTARVLANRSRLRVLRHVLLNPGCTVTAVASCNGLSVSHASQALRALNARGFLRVDRVSRYVQYRAEPDARIPAAAALHAAVAQALLKHAPDAVDHVFRCATGFTHPRRCELLRILKHGPLRPCHLRYLAHISLPSLGRHVAKLRRRGIIIRLDKRYGLPATPEPLVGAFVAAVCAYT